MFAVATRLNAQLVETSFDQSVAPFLKVWSTRNREDVNVVFLHKNDTSDSVAVALNITAPSNNFKFPVAELSTLIAPTLAEQFNVTFAGRTWMNTKQGEPIGERKIIKVSPVVDQSGAFATYNVVIAPASGALLNITVSQEAEHRHARLNKKLALNKH